jgi:hypothetical protein
VRLHRPHVAPLRLRSQADSVRCCCRGIGRPIRGRA